MKKTPESHGYELDMQPNYDFRGGVRGKYVDRVPADAVAVILESDVAEHFGDSASVNEALRRLLE